jgi:hypothetical protein
MRKRYISGRSPTIFQQRGLAAFKGQQALRFGWHPPRYGRSELGRGMPSHPASLAFPFFSRRGTSSSAPYITRVQHSLIAHPCSHALFAPTMLGFRRVEHWNHAHSIRPVHMLSDCAAGALWRLWEHYNNKYSGAAVSFDHWQLRWAQHLSSALQLRSRVRVLPSWFAL